MIGPVTDDRVRATARPRHGVVRDRFSRRYDARAESVVRREEEMTPMPPCRVGPALAAEPQPATTKPLPPRSYERERVTGFPLSYVPRAGHPLAYARSYAEIQLHS